MMFRLGSVGYGSAHRARSKNTAPNAYIFAGERRGAPLNMANLARRVILPAITAAKVTFDDGSGLEWKGWHAIRRGLTSNLYELGISGKVILSILRHSSINTTMEIYVQTDQTASRDATQKLEAAIFPFGGLVAQRLERAAHNRKVPGSNPGEPTKTLPYVFQTSSPSNLTIMHRSDVIECETEVPEAKGFPRQPTNRRYFARTGKQHSHLARVFPQTRALPRSRLPQSGLFGRLESLSG
jgi:hypothetical protein